MLSPTSRRAAWRRLRLGIPTLLGLRPRGFFIPYRYAADLPPRDPANAYPEIGEILDRSRPAFAWLLREIERHSGALRAMRGEPKGMPRWDQDWFPRLDGAAAYALVRAHKPYRIVEIGSGHSTRFMVRALRDEGVECRFTAIDPAPRASLAALGQVRHVPTTLQNLFADDRADGPAGGKAVAAHCLAELEAGDILFVDSSHILMPGSDVDLIVNRVLPRLPAGVMVHVHDIFLPDGYPEHWAWRGYNEQNAIATLLASGAYEVLFASHYVSTRMPEAFDAEGIAALPLVPGAFESSLWLIKRVETISAGA